MIKLTRLDGRQIIINSDLIESIEETPDTILSFTTGRKMMVREKLEEVLNLVMEYRSRFPMYAIPAGEQKIDHNRHDRNES
ncbi:MAG: flagellar FlbD family protein [Candidatus Krumholzibacteriota bacterium]|nr:flagellar FlbD family protein [Candidatus Krumholzibacteriota bacterium]